LIDLRKKNPKQDLKKKDLLEKIEIENGKFMEIRK
jgi:hypothetical protein